MSSLRKEWKGFAGIVFSPWVIVLFLTAIAFDAVLVHYTSKLSTPGANIDISLVTVLAFIASLSSGILGGVIGKRWDDFIGERVIVTRGKSAVRSLKLLLGNIVALERRVNKYLERHIDENQRENQTPEVIRTYLEEVIERCRVLGEETISSIENWTDIVPGADIKTQIGLISELTSEIEQLALQLHDLTAELEETKGISETETKRLHAEIRKKEKELSEARRELEQKRIGITGVTVPSVQLTSGSFTLPSAGLVLGGSTFIDAGKIDPGIYSTRTAKCSECGKTFTEPTGLISKPSLCPECRSENAS